MEMAEFTLRQSGVTVDTFTAAHRIPGVPFSAIAPTATAQRA
jgi:hypothetical protein